jgi:ribonuclease HII
MEVLERNKPTWIVGIDEVGRGPLAGPVYVCAVAIPLVLYKKMRWKGLRDSKQLTEISRDRWYAHARRLEEERKAVIALSFRSASSIDAQGISSSIRACIKSALKQLKLDPKDCLILLDGGLKAPTEYIYQQTIIRGDDSQKIISLASVVAKVTRDAVMRNWHKKYPAYNWFENKGYGTKAHQAALISAGVTDLHRKSFLGRVLDK